MAGKTQLGRELEAAIGHECWGVIASGDPGEALVLQCGEKLRRAIRVSNPELSFLHRTYEGELRFAVECPWRLEAARGVIASSTDRSKEEPPPISALEGRRIEQVEALGEALDLVVRFSGGLVLRAFATRIDPHGKRADWTFQSPAASVVARRGRVEIESQLRAKAKMSELKRKLSGEEDDVVTRLGKGKKKSKKDPQD